MANLTHFDNFGNARMVNVSNKHETERKAQAEACISMKPQTLSMIAEGRAGKGDVLGVAQLAGIMAAKKTSDLIPLCHPLSLDSVTVDLECNMENATVMITSTCQTNSRTGVEMEALTAVSIAALTVYDMCKSVDRTVTIEATRLIFKSGGKSGTFQAD